MRLNRCIGVALIVVAAAVLLPNAALGLSQTVTIRGFAFLPPSATIAAGESITWTNADSTAHTATSNTPGAFDTLVIPVGASKPITFATAGTYAYHCSIHASMTGTITVQAPTPAPTPPPTPVPTAPPTPATAPPTVPATAVPTVTATASPAATPPVPSASPSPSAVPTATSTPRPSLIVALPSPSAAPAAPAFGDGPGPLLAVGAVAAAAALAGLAFYLYRRR